MREIGRFEMVDNFDDIIPDVEKFISEQKELIEMGGCLNRVAISIWLEYLFDAFCKFKDPETRSKILKCKRDILELSHAKKEKYE